MQTGRMPLTYLLTCDWASYTGWPWCMYVCLSVRRITQNHSRSTKSEFTNRYIWVLAYMSSLVSQISWHWSKLDQTSINLNITSWTQICCDGSSLNMGFIWRYPTLSSQEGFKGHKFDMVSCQNGLMDFIETWQEDNTTNESYYACFLRSRSLTLRNYGQLFFKF